ncbi:helix-turn-helix domain-containing protein [Robinsoniella sp. KNHs210]|uniref:helix-turn-helix domain-containing protein n=1 Tax=Robinsoniella sp. KNHs210 TaxID=1469950 RepID=UPI0005C7B069|nr:helix-turn-helix transcriptional regulator [Robinsoniella sp. KNHs210]
MLFKRIVELCNSERITIAELERNLHFGNGTIRNWESKNPSLEKVKEVAEYFGVSIDFLVSELKIPSKESRNLAYKLDEYSDKQKSLIKCYMSLIEHDEVEV